MNMEKIDEAIVSTEQLAALYKKAEATAVQMAQALRLVKLFPEINDSKDAYRLHWENRYTCLFIHGDRAPVKLTPRDRVYLFTGETYETDRAASAAERRKKATNGYPQLYK